MSMEFGVVLGIAALAVIVLGLRWKRGKNC
jgi:hypothetical protein